MRKEIRNITFRLLTILFFFGSLPTSHASHSMGSDLTYHCLGGNTYEIELSFYRDCAGVEADTGGFIVFQSSCFPADSVEIFQIAGTGQEISPVCPANTTTCNGGTFTGIQEYIYRGTITLPGPCADWQFSYNLCCRNNAITNIVNPGQTQMYIYATLNNLITPCNNSPTFSNKPVPFTCLGQQFCYNHGAYDQDGDSLTYSLITPYNSAGTPITYSNPWTANNPLTSSPGVTLNPLTGDICMTPTALEITVMAVLVNEYRNGVLIGSVERDIQVTVINCTNVIPAMSGINGTNSFSQTVCAGAQTCFSIFSSDVDNGQNTFVSWDYSIPNATFTTFPGTRENASFCWTPTTAEINPNPYCFTVTVRDDNCPFVGTQTFSYCITVVGVNANAGPDLSVACNATTTLTASASGGSGIYSYQWNNGSVTQTTSGGAGTYVVTVSDGMCSDQDTALVAPAAGAPLAAFTTNFNCTSLNVAFTDLTTINGGTIASYAWNFGDGTTSAIQNPTHAYAAVGNYNVQLIVTSASGCIDTLTQQLHLTLNVPNALYTLNNGCQGTQINFTNQSTSPTTITNWLWDFGDGSTSTVTSPAHIYATSGNYNVNLVITNVDGCKDSVIHQTTVYPLPTANAGLNDTICTGGVATLSASGGASYLWNPGPYAGATINVNPTTSQTFVVTVTSANGCTATDAASVVVVRPPQLFLQNRTICVGASTTLTANVQGGGGGGGGPYTYLWAGGLGTTQQISVSPAVTTIYPITVTNGYGCSTTDTITVTVNSAPTATINPSQTICQGDSAILTAGGGGNYQWTNVGGGQSQNAQVTVTPNTTTVYTVTVSQQGGCSSTATTTVNVAQAPNANAGPDQAVCGGTSVNLTATGGTTYTWQPGNINGAAITVTPLVNTNYTVTVTDANGCSSIDSVLVTINSAAIANAGPDQTTCVGGSITLTGSGGGTYTWNPGAINAQQISISPSSTSSYSLTVTDANGCQNTDVVTININQAPPAEAGPGQSICLGASATLTASGGTSYLWDAGGQTTNQISVTPAASTLYHVTVTDTNGCVATDSVNVNIYALPLADAGLDQAICFGANTTLTATGGVSYVWSPGAIAGATLNVNPTTTSTYTVNVTDANGCQASDQVDVIINPLPAANAGADQAICIGSSATLNATGGTHFLWTPTNDTTQQLVVTPAVNSDYIVTVTDANGCHLNDTVGVTINSLPTTTMSSTDALCFGGTTGTATVVPSVTPGPYSYSWSPSLAITATATGLSAGYHTVRVTDGNGCVRVDSILVGQPPAILLITDSTAALCFGTSTGKASVFANGGGAGFTYSWSPSGGTDSIANSLAAGLYTVTVTDVAGCTQTASVNVAQPTALNLQMSSQATSCYNGGNGSASVLVTGGTASYSYQWSSSGGTNAGASNLSQGNYSVTVTDANGCTSSNTVVVNQPTVLVMNTNTTPANCNVADGTASVAVVGGTPNYTYLWTPGNINTANANNLFAGVYTVRVTDANGCTMTTTANVGSTGGPVINATTTANVNCNGGNDGAASVNVLSGNGPFTFSWTPGGFVNQVENALPAAHYSIQATDANGCITIDTITISEPTVISGTTSTTPASCNGYSNGSATVVAQGGVGPYSYSWSPMGGNGATANGLAADTYTVTITDSHGCTRTANATVNEPTGINLSMNATPVSCFGVADGSASVTANGGSGNFTYQWSPSGGSSNVAIHLLSGNYTVAITDANGCITTSSVYVDQPDQLTAVASSLPVSCNGGNTGSASVLPSGGTPNYSYVWSPSGGTNSTALNLGAGNYSVLITDVNGCSTTATTVVQQATPLSLSVASVPTICIGQSIDLEALVNGGVGPYQLHWNTNDTGSTVEVSPNTTTTYTVSVVDANNCVTDPANVEVAVYPPLDVTAIGPAPICEGTETELEAIGSGGNGGPYTYTWNEASIFGSNPTVSPSHDSTFTVTFSDGCSPVVTDAVNIIVNPLPYVDFTPHVITGCTPVTVDFHNFYPVSAGSTFFWDLQDNAFSTDTNPTHIYTTPGSYDVTLTIVTAEGCSDNATVDNAVVVYGYPTANFSQSADQVSIFYPDVTFMDNSASAVSWQWDFGDGTTLTDVLSPLHTYSDTGNYSVQLIVTSEGGCIDTTYGLVRVEPEFTIFIPNAFTPNGDGTNDSFFATGVGFIDYEMLIIDRWGKEIFRSVDKSQQWDGSYYYNDNMCQNDVYEYIVSVHDYNGKLHKLIGHVTLVR